MEPGFYIWVGNQWHLLYTDKTHDEYMKAVCDLRDHFHLEYWRETDTVGEHELFAKY